MARSFDIIDVDQRSEEWRTARLGRLTGASADAILADGRKKGEPSVMRAKLLRRLVTEHLTGYPQEPAFSTFAMERGIEVEPLARSAYEALTGNLVRTSGFLSHRDLLAGCSLDGYVGGFEGIIEIKCPLSTTHAEWLRAGVLPPDHRAQVTHNLWIVGEACAWCDFVSFDDRFRDPRFHLFVKRVMRGELDIEGYDRKARAFLIEMEAEYRSYLGWRAEVA